MKTNGKKAIIATMAIAMAAGIAGSISGTVAWFQYNTRVTSEFTGTTAKCTEFLQVRTARNVVEVKGYEASAPSSGYSAGEKYVNSSDHKIYTAADDGNGGVDFGEGTPVLKNVVYKVGDDLHVWNGTAWEASPKIYGDWKTTLTGTDIAAAAAGSEVDGLKPVTRPGANADVLGTLFGQPVCGYEQYETGSYHWQTAELSDYYGFGLQFRVLDINGSEVMNGATNSLYAKDVYLTDITVSQIAVTGKKDISPAVRVFVDGGVDGKRALLGPGAGSEATESIDTHGALDLGGAVGNDTLRDVPNAYAFNTAATELDYGKDKKTQTFYNMNKRMASGVSNGIYPQNDGEGHLTGGRVLAQTPASDGTAAVADNAYPTVNFTIFLEGWQKVGTTPSALWSSSEFIGAQFNIGMSFGVTTLD